jgi:hypothetical protein
MEQVKIESTQRHLIQLEQQEEVLTDYKSSIFFYFCDPVEAYLEKFVILDLIFTCCKIGFGLHSFLLVFPLFSIQGGSKFQLVNQILDWLHWKCDFT